MSAPAFAFRLLLYTSTEALALHVTKLSNLLTVHVNLFTPLCKLLTCVVATVGFVGTPVPPSLVLQKPLPRFAGSAFNVAILLQTVTLLESMFAITLLYFTVAVSDVVQLPLPTITQRKRLNPELKLRTVVVLLWEVSN